MLLGLKSTPDAGWVYAGAYTDTTIGAWQYDRLFVTKIDSNWSHEWTHIIGYKSIDNYNFLRDIVIDRDGNFIVAGQYRTGNPDFPDPNPATSAIATKISPTGEILWTNIVKAYENGPENGLLMFTTNVSLLSSGNIILGGYLYRFLPLGLQNEGWLAKFSPIGEVLDEPDPMCGFVSTQHPQTDLASTIKCYPNPVENFVVFDLNGLTAEVRYGKITIYDLMGKIIVETPLATNTKNTTINMQNVFDGIYLYRITSGHTLIHSGKFIVQRH